LDEQERKGLSQYAKYCLVSCWTQSEVESISMWDMYADRMKGVRIGLPEDFFVENALCPIDVKYDDKVYGNFRNHEINDVNLLGIHKNKVWEFQKEVRFRMFLIMKNKTELEITFCEKEFQNYWMCTKEPPDKNRSVPRFSKISADKISEMKILLAPKTNNAHKHIVKSLAEKAGIPIENIEKSKLRIQ